MNEIKGAYMASCYSYESTVVLLHTPLDLCWWVNSLPLPLGSVLLDRWQKQDPNRRNLESADEWTKLLLGSEYRKRQIPNMTFLENKIILHFIDIKYPLLFYLQPQQCARSLKLFLLNDALIHSLMLALSITVCSVFCTASTALLTCQFENTVVQLSFPRYA